MERRGGCGLLVHLGRRGTGRHPHHRPLPTRRPRHHRGTRRRPARPDRRRPDTRTAPSSSTATSAHRKSSPRRRARTSGCNQRTTGDAAQGSPARSNSCCRRGRRTTRGCSRSCGVAGPSGLASAVQRRGVGTRDQNRDQDEARRLARVAIDGTPVVMRPVIGRDGGARGRGMRRPFGCS